MPEIQSPDPGRKLQERYNLVGEGPTPFLSPEIVPVAIVDDLTEADVFSQEFERTAVGFITAVANAGERAVMDLRNPPGSNLLFITEDMAFNGDIAQSLLYFLEDTGPDVDSDNTAWRDGRVSGNPRGQVVGSSFSGALPTATDRRFMELNVPNLLPLRYVINPGVRLRILALTTDTTIQITLYWRERKIQTRRLGAGGMGGGL